MTLQPSINTRLSLDVQLPRLREWRTKRALSQDELGRLSALSRTTIIQLEKGRNAWPQTQRKLAKALRVKPEELL